MTVIPVKEYLSFTNLCTSEELQIFLWKYSKCLRYFELNLMQNYLKGNNFLLIGKLMPNSLF